MRLVDGAIKFMKEDFHQHKELFKSLKHKQNPHTLFIGCSDSRIIPNLITNTGPGELFVIRNIANIIPPYRVGSDYLATTSAIEYALNFLEIKNIVLCGHSNCGGCEFIYKNTTELNTNVKNWLSILEPIKNEVLKYAKNDKDMRAYLTEKMNLVNSLDNLLTYPGLKLALEQGKVNIHIWYYIIQNGQIYEYDLKKKNFYLLESKE